MTVLDAAIIGSGFSGLCAAIHLKKAGFENIQILEKASEVGGTWRENTYPGAACDVQSHLYSFSFAPNPNWSHVFSGWQEIQNYIVQTSHQFGLRPHIKFNAEVASATYDEQNQIWEITFTNGESLRARTLIMGTGPLHVPSIPDIKGLKKFKGDVFHSSQWNHDIDLSEKRVASIGTGGSAIQYVPEVAKKAKTLSVFQRTPAWVLPRNERAYTSFEKWLFKHVPGWRRLYRTWLYLTNEARILPFRHPVFIRISESVSKWHMKRSIKDPELRKKLTPKYTIGCKRILISNQYYPTFNRRNVNLITDRISEIRDHSIVTVDQSGIETEHQVDTLILGTGFVADPTQYMESMPITGVDGKTLLDVWQGNANAYYGLNVSGFPNLFMMVGPNTGLGHNSVIFMIEAQTNYIIDALKKLRKKGRGHLTGSVDVKRQTQELFNKKLYEELEGTVWQTGCQSWYIKENGKNFTIWPKSTISYYFQTKKVKDDAFIWNVSDVNSVNVNDVSPNRKTTIKEGTSV